MFELISKKINTILCYKIFLNWTQLFTLGESSKDIDADLAERMSAMKRPGESDMDFY